MRDMLRSVCKAGGELGCSCADQNYQWFGGHCRELMVQTVRKFLASPSLTAGGVNTSSYLSLADSGLRRAWLDKLNAIAPAVENLACHQEQCDFDGVMVKVSRQALDQVLNAVNDLAVSFVTAPATEQPSEAQPSAPDVREAIARADVRRIVKGLINDGELPEYETQDDNGLEAGEYVDLFFKILALLSAKGER